MAILENLNHQQSLPLTYGVQVSPVKTSATQTQTGKVYQESEVDFSMTLWDLLKKFSQNGLSWKMSRASYLPRKENLLSQLSTPWKRMGIWGGGFRATLQMRAYPKTVTEYSLSQLLEQTVPINSLLTAANCTGILRREEKAQRKLDPIFEKALKETIRLWCNVAEASDTPMQVAFAPRYVPKLESIKEVIQTDRYSVARNLTWNECEKLMGFPEGWTVVEGD